jgi:two-component system, cell cycle sensor histidine kinase PleC
MHEDNREKLQASTCDQILDAGRSLKRRIFAATALIVVFICAVAGFLVDDQRRSAIERASAHSANLSAAFEEQVRRVMDGVAGAIDLITHRIEKEGPNFNLSEWASLIPEVARSTIQLTIIGPDGWMRESSLSKTPTKVDLSDREHFRVQRDNPNLGLFIGKPVLGRVSKQITIQVTRRIQAADGGFGGVLVFSLNPDFLTSLHRQVDLGKAGHVTVVGMDAIIRARFTSSDASETLGVGSSLAKAALMREAQTGDKGSYVTRSVVDGTVRLYNWRRIKGYPLLVTVGLGRDEALSTANRHAFMILAIGGAAILIVGIMALMLSREISRRAAHEVALYRESENVRAAHAELKTQHSALIAKSAQVAEERINLQKANTELSLARERSETANRAKSAFLANMSHELRTPLNAIIGFSEIMREKIFGELSDRYVEYAGSIHQSGSALLGIIDQVLHFAKLEAGRIELSDDVQPLSRIVEPALKSVQAQAENRQIELSASVPAGISARGDRERLTQVLMNLLSNAVKFTPVGGRVAMDAHLEEDGGLCLTVADDGIGMSPNEIECALEHFRQIDNSFTKRFQGIGLGLPLARQLAELHDGSLSIESMPGLGTKVRFRLPASRVAVANETPRREEEPCPAPALREAA